MGDAFPCSPQGLGIEPGGSRPTSNTELFKPVSIVGGIYSSGLTSHPEKIFRENESNVIGLSVGDATVRVNIIPNRQWFYPKRVQETGNGREKNLN